MKTSSYTLTLALGISLSVGYCVVLSAAQQGARNIVRQQAEILEPQLRINTVGHTAEVRAIGFTADSKRLCTTGFDKSVLVWSIDTATPNQLSLAKERSLLWEIGPGQRGAVYAMAISDSSDRLAIGGYGNRGQAGELVAFETASGQTVHAEYGGGHSQSVVGLDYSADGKWLASRSVDGEVRLRSTAKDDWKTPQEIAPRSKHLWQFAPLAILGNNIVAYPVVRRRDGDANVWEIRRYGIEIQRHYQPLETDLRRDVTAVTASSDGRFLAAADSLGDLYLWNFSQSGNPVPSVLLNRTQRGRKIAISLAFGSTGNTLLAGTLQGELIRWDVTTLQSRSIASGAKPVWACAISPDESLVASSDGDDVIIQQLDAPQHTARMTSDHGIRKVVFKNSLDSKYSVQITGIDDSSATFDPKKLRLRLLRGQKNITIERNRPEWTATQDSVNSNIQVKRNDVDHCTIEDFRRDTHGTITGQAFFTTSDQRTVMAVGTYGGTSCLYVYDVSKAEDPRMLRHFVGHFDKVNSIDFSPDGRYLVTGSDDGTVRYWTLEGASSGPELMRRWGVEFEDDSLVVKEISNAGPLYVKGLRAGDTITRIVWPDTPTQNLEAATRAEIIYHLKSRPTATQIIFHTTRGNDDQPEFEGVDLWRPILSVYKKGGDWIAWHPVGYYAASAGGEGLMGWQFNNKKGLPPLFYDATRFAETLNRPKAIEMLLDEGKLPDTNDDAIGISSPQDIKPPLVTITSPILKPEQVTGALTVSALAKSQNYPLVSLQLIRNGRPYDDAQIFAGGKMTEAATWQVDLLPGENVFHVVAATERSQGETRRFRVDYDVEQVKPSFYGLAIGISEYPGRLALRYASSDAEGFSRTINQYSQPLFDKVQITPFVDNAATKSGIRGALEQLNEDVTPNDFAVVFFSGHGYRQLDPKSQQDQFFFFPIDGDTKRIEETCVSETVIKDFCKRNKAKRLILVFDACHSGSSYLNDLAQKLVRDDYGVVVMASSTAEEVSWEKPEWKAGAFTKALIEGLEGLADTNRDKRVKNIELDLYVYTRVQELTQGAQTPVSAKPINFTPIDLTRVK